MNNLDSQANSTEDLLPDIEAMYQSFMATNELRDASQQILDLAIHLTGAENCSLMLLNGHGQLYVLNSSGLAGAALKSALVNVGEGIAGQVADQGRPLLVEDIATDERLSINYRSNRRKTNSFIACPITTRERVIGVLNLSDKNTGEPFNPHDMDQAQLISMIAAVALRSFLSGGNFRIPESEITQIYHRLVEAECNNREFVARIAHDIRAPLNNIKGAVYYLKNSAGQDPAENLDFYEIIEKEVDYLISYLDDGTRDYERMLNRLADIEEEEKYKHLLE